MMLSWLRQLFETSGVENETKSDIGFSTLHNVDTNRTPTLKQRRNNASERWSNVKTTL